ncbi:MAG: hypothetical protein JNL79_04975 [Myxococcales bacterium]|nr:hypothetical protein [Myxococcales bacterium]
MAKEVVVPFPDRVGPTTHVRSTLLCASLQSIRSRGLQDVYLAALPEVDRLEMLAMTPGAWLPVERALIHYAACDRLPLDRNARLEIGADVARRIQKSLLNVIVRLTKEAGVGPWSVLTRAEKLRLPTWQGGGIQVEKLGVKDARLEWIRQPCARSEHFRLGFLGVVKGLCELYCRRVVTKEEGAPEDDRFVQLVSWA